MVTDDEMIEMIKKDKISLVINTQPGEKYLKGMVLY